MVSKYLVIMIFIGSLLGCINTSSDDGKIHIDCGPSSLAVGNKYIYSFEKENSISKTIEYSIIEKSYEYFQIEIVENDIATTHFKPSCESGKAVLSLDGLSDESLYLLYDVGWIGEKYQRTKESLFLSLQEKVDKIKSTDSNEFESSIREKLGCSSSEFEFSDKVHVARKCSETSELQDDTPIIFHTYSIYDIENALTPMRAIIQKEFLIEDSLWARLKLVDQEFL